MFKKLLLIILALLWAMPVLGATYDITKEGDGVTNISCAAGGVCGASACQPDDILEVDGDADWSDERIVVADPTGSEGHPIIIQNESGKVTTLNYDVNEPNLRIARGNYVTIRSSDTSDMSFKITDGKNGIALAQP